MTNGVFFIETATKETNNRVKDLEQWDRRIHSTLLGDNIELWNRTVADKTRIFSFIGFTSNNLLKVWSLHTRVSCDYSPESFVFFFFFFLFPFYVNWLVMLDYGLVQSLAATFYGMSATFNDWKKVIRLPLLADNIIKGCFDHLSRWSQGQKKERKN